MSIERVAVVDDDPDDLDLTEMAVAAAGYIVVRMPPIERLDDAVGWVAANADAVVSDHQLSWGGYGAYSGAELVARCYSLGIPGVLVTGFLSSIETTIREHRRRVPELVTRRYLDGERMELAILRASAELSDRPGPTRKPHPAIVRVERANPDAPDQVFVVIPQWDGRVKISIRADRLGSFPEGGADLNLLEHRRYIGIVNTGADEPDELYFEEMTDAGPVPSEEELA